MKRVSLLNSINSLGLKNRSSQSLIRKESMLRVREFNQKGSKYDSEESRNDSSVHDDFWVIHINYDHPFLEVDRAPFTVMEESSLSKIHFLFTMLNLSQLFVLRKGVLVGIITKNDFLKKKRMVIETSKAERLNEIGAKPDAELSEIVSVQMNPHQHERAHGNAFEESKK